MQFLRFKIEKMSIRWLGGVAGALTPCPAIVGLIQLLIVNVGGVDEQCDVTLTP